MNLNVKAISSFNGEKGQSEYLKQTESLVENYDVEA